jgi:tetratricopeptide (TPR) repeat protein
MEPHSGLPVRKTELVEALRNLKSISEPVRGVALGLLDEEYTTHEEALQFSTAAAPILHELPSTQAEFEEALAWAEHAYELEPDTDETVFTYGLALLRCGRSEDALGYLEKSIDILADRNMTSLHLAALAIAQHTSGNRETARLTLAKAMDPDGFGRWRFSVIQNMVLEAAQLIEPNNEGPDLLGRGRGHARDQLWDDAIADLERAERLLVGDMRSLCLHELAQIYLKKGRVTEHKRLCQMLKADFDLENDEVAASRLIAASVLVSTTFDSWSELLQVTRGHDLPPDLRAAVLYRAGLIKECNTVLDAVEQERRLNGWELAFAAMAKHRVGSTQRARKYMAAYQAWCNLDRFNDWDRRENRMLLLREIETILGSTDSGPEVD